MPLQIIGNLEKNRIDAYPEFTQTVNGVLTFEGEGNELRIKQPKQIGYLEMSLRHGSSVDIDEGQYAAHFSVHVSAEGASVRIGRNNYFNGHVRILVHETASVLIGSECLFATDSEITCGDFHSIFDVETGQRVNLPKNIIIDDHVWLGSRVTILKGAHIGRDSVVGTGAVVTRHFPPGSAVAGVPARVIRSGITWQI